MQTRIVKRWTRSTLPRVTGQTRGADGAPSRCPTISPALIADTGRFIAGIASYDAILRIAHLETVSAESAQKLSSLTIENKSLSYQLENEKKLISSEMLAQLDGTWVNQDPKTPGITRFQIERRGSQVFVHAWGACHPSECDWGEQRALIDENSAILLWDQGFVFRKMEIRLNKKTDLTADYLSVYTDDSGRKKHETVEMFSYRATNNPTASDSSAPSPAPHPADTAGSH
jgi:hypothetical protein